MKPIFLIFALLLSAANAFAAGTHQPYAGFQDRSITSLSEADIEELSTGGGWGLALPAELNGYPGPAHLLELKEQIGLSGDQQMAIEIVFDAMREEAIAVGKRLIDAEAGLDQAFESGAVTPETLRNLIAAAEAARAELRFVHLSRHLMTGELLTAAQIERYAQLRGYADDPCASVPEGHNPTMWRRHNGCEN